MERSRPLADEVLRYEQTLRRRVGARSLDGTDPTLTQLLRTIEDRRARRVRTAPTAAGRPRPAPGRRPSPPARGEQPDPSGATTGAPRILALEPLGPDVRVFRIARPSGLTFRAGQHVKVGVPGGRREEFSIASAPHEPHLDLAIERRDRGRVTPALFALRVGDAVEVSSTAKGRLTLDRDATSHLMVATVTGIAPLRSMVRDALHRGTTATFTILLGASHATELPFHDELTALATGDERVTYVPAVSRPGVPANRAWTGTTGRIDAVARTVAARLDPATTHVYAVGNAGMIASVRRDLGGAGFPVHTESYGG